MRRAAGTGIAAVAVALAGAAAVSSPAEAQTGARACAWSDPVNAHPYPFVRGRRYSLPRCRLATRGTRDEAFRDPAARRHFETLRPNRRHGGRRVWTFVDSLGRRLAVVALRRGRWVVRNPRTGRTIYSQGRPANFKFQLQGRACMASDWLERHYALVAIHVGRQRTRIRGRRPGRRRDLVPYQLRAFVRRQALPRRNMRGGRVRAVVDHYAVDCSGSVLEQPRPEAVRNPYFRTRRHQYMGRDGKSRTYSTYNPKRLYGGAHYLLTHTTGVRGGGVVRAVVRARDRVSIVDTFSYCDPNVWRRLRRPVVRWSFGRVEGTRIWGWMPRWC